MVINIYPGKHFPQLKLLFNTNRYFHDKMWSRIITSKNMNYIIKIGKRSIKIIASSKLSDWDAYRIKDYIKTVFGNRKLLIDSTDDIPWLRDMENISVHVSKITK